MSADPPRFDIRLLYVALDRQRADRGLTWAQAAREIGNVAPSTLTGIRDRRVVEGDGVLQMLRWLNRSPESFLSNRDGVSHPGELLPSVASGRVLRFDAPAIYAALDAMRATRSMTWPAVARDVGGLTAASLTRLHTGGRVSFPDIMRIAAWLGRPVASLTRVADR